jgi:hypothetical protein
MILRRVIGHFRKQEWTAIAIDFLIVVIGVFVGLQVNDWNEARKERALERQYLVRIASDLEQSIGDIEHAIRRTRERQAFGELLMASIDDPAVVRVDPGRFVAAIMFGGYTLSPDVRSQTFDEIKSAGELNVVRDDQLRLDLTEFYTSIQGTAQWDYIRELRQTEHMKHSAGILTYDQIMRVSGAEGIPTADEDEAAAAHKRMLDRPAFIDWLPTVADRTDDFRRYNEWLAATQALRVRILTALGEAVPGHGGEEVPE